MGGLGLQADDAGVLAWQLVLASLRRAVLGLVDEFHPLLRRQPEDAEALPDEIALLLTETPLGVDDTLLCASWKLPLLKALEPALARWLTAFGVEEGSAAVIAARLPRRFGLAMWDEWAAHPQTYKPLFDAVMGPIQRPPDLDDLRRRYLDYISDTYRYLDLKGLPGFIEAVEKAAGLRLREVFTAIQATLDGPAGETWERVLDKPPKFDLESPGAESPGGLRRRSLDPLPPDSSALVLLGDPGAGKSTLLKHLALSVIRDEVAPLPILVPLSAYAEAMRAEPQPLRTFLSVYQGTRRDSLGDLTPLFEHAIERGRALVLLDGLDEVQTDPGSLVKRVEDFVREIVPAVDADPEPSAIPPATASSSPAASSATENTLSPIRVGLRLRSATGAGTASASLPSAGPAPWNWPLPADTRRRRSSRGRRPSATSCWHQSLPIRRSSSLLATRCWRPSSR